MAEYYKEILGLDKHITLSRLRIREIVETMLGVYDHEQTDIDVPFPLVTRKKNSLRDWGTINAYAKLLALDAPAKTNMSIDELLDLDTLSFINILESVEIQNTVVAEAIAKASAGK